MIEKEDIKIGLEFVLPFREDEYEEEVRRDLDRRINGEDCPVLPMYKTDLETLDEFQKTIVTAIRPIFKVAGSPREYFETSSEPRSLGSFVKVACNNIKDKVFYLSTKDIMERGETLIRKKVESKEGVATMINREGIKEGLKFRLPNNKIERKHPGATDMCESVQYLTTLKTPRGDKNYVTLQVPLFEVCGGPKLISSADKKDPHCAWVGEYIKVRSDALGKKPLYISLGDVMQRGRRAIDANLCYREPEERLGVQLYLWWQSQRREKYRMEHYGCSLDPIDVLSKLSAFTEQPTGDADAFRDITNGMYDTFKVKNHDYGNSFAELFKECGMTYAYGHLSEKLKRVKSLMSDEAKVKGESMRDSLLDLANYAILTIMELDKTSMPKNAPAEEKYDWYGSPANIERILQREFNNEMQKND